uniref:Uncharacterized protein n=1 Tax=Pararge aegeria TaxID=116150 RepID=S4PII3_9NEOP
MKCTCFNDKGKIVSKTAWLRVGHNVLKCTDSHLASTVELKPSYSEKRLVPCSMMVMILSKFERHANNSYVK